MKWITGMKCMLQETCFSGLVFLITPAGQGLNMGGHEHWSLREPVASLLWLLPKYVGFSEPALWIPSLAPSVQG